MHNLSMVQALSVWGDLVEALRGVNAYGENVAQVYVYRLQPRCPMSELGCGKIGMDAKVELTTSANRSLHSLIEHFISYYESTVELDGKQFGEWLKESDNDWRWHIKVMPTQEKTDGTSVE